METKKSSTYNTFSIIRNRNTPTKGQLPDGTWVYPQEKFWVEDMNGYIFCTRYSDHFLYQVPVEARPRFPGPIYRCSCGSPAVYVAPDTYVYGASPQGLMFVCKHHVDFGKHATGGDRWI